MSAIRTSSMPMRRWTAQEVLRMVEAGILHEDDPYELLDGVLIEMSPQGPYHAVIVTRLLRRLEGCLAPGVHTRQQMPVAAGDFGLPEPDLAVVPGAIEDYTQRHPRTDESIVLIEVSVTTQQADEAKAAVYAAAGAPVYWRVDVKERALVVHELPSGDRYHRVTTLAEDQEVRVPGTDERWLVASLFP